MSLQSRHRRLRRGRAPPGLNQARFRATAVGDRPYDAIHGNDEHEQGHPRRDPTRPRAVRGGARPRFRAGDSERARQLGRRLGELRQPADRPPRGRARDRLARAEQVGVTRETIDQMDAEHARWLRPWPTLARRWRHWCRTPEPASPRPHSAAIRRLKDVTVDPPRPRGGADRADLPRASTTPGDEGHGQAVRQGRPVQGAARSWPGSRDGATARHEAGAQGERARTRRGRDGGVFGRSYRKNVAPVWKA